MEARRYQTLLQDPEAFKAVDGLSFVELYRYEACFYADDYAVMSRANDIQDESINEYRKGELLEKDVDRWLAETVSTWHFVHTCVNTNAAPCTREIFDNYSAH